MRSRAPAMLCAAIAACLMLPAAGWAADTGKPYSAEVTPAQAADLKARGFDLEEALVDPTDTGIREVQIIATDKQRAALEGDGMDLSALAIDKPVAKSKALGDSPNAYFNVYRSYSEKHGIADQMRQLAGDNPDVMKLEQIGTSGRGQPILVIKLTADARNVPDGSRDALLFSALNHAREWIAAEQGRRLPIWFAQHKNDPKIKELLQTRELWFLPIMNPDGYDFTFTCGTGSELTGCDYRKQSPNNRFWRKTLRDNDANGIYGNGQDGVDPNRNYPAKRGIDEEGASNSFTSETYRGPYALSEPENLAFDRLLRRVHFLGNVNYHSAGQLLLTPVSYTTDYAPPDATLFNAITGTDGDSAVFPYTPQRSSDLYESNGDTIDNAYLNYGVIGWTPEMDTCATMGDENPSCNQFASPDDEEKVEAIFEKNLQFALNVIESPPSLGKPKNFDPNPSEYQVKATRDIQASVFDVSYGNPQPIEAIVRRSLGPADVRLTLQTPGKGDLPAVVRMQPAPAGERYGEAPGVYFRRMRAYTPATFPARGTPGSQNYVPPRSPAVGDVISVTVLAGGLAQDFSYRVAALRQDPAKKRVLVVAAEDYTGVSPNVEPGYDDAPRYLAERVDALRELGYEVETFNIDAPPQNAGTPAIKYPTFLGVLSHFDAVNYYSGDDFAPQDPTNPDPRRMPSAATQTGSQEMAGWAHHVMLELRDFANEGGKLIVDGRNVHQPFTTDARGGNSGNTLTAVGPYTWTPDKLYGFNYPPGNSGDDDLPGTAFQRSRAISNDTWQNYLGVIARQSGIGTAPDGALPDVNPVLTDLPIAPKADGVFAGMGTITLDESASGDPNEGADGSPLPMRKLPVRLRTWSPVSYNEPLRRERVEADYDAPSAQVRGGGAIVSTRDAVTFGFGLEQANAATRKELLRRSLDYLLPTTADTTPPTIDAFKYPEENFQATPANPVELEVTAYDERGDMKQVNLYANGQPYASVPVYPFQFRYFPPASAVGSTVTLTAEAVDKAGNKSTKDLHIRVVAPPPDPTVILAPVPIAPPTLTGTPTVGSTLACVNGGFANSPDSTTYEWLRNGAVIAGARQ